MTPYTTIYCAAKAERDYLWWPWLRNAPWMGKVYARDGVCCYCRKKVPTA